MEYLRFIFMPPDALVFSALKFRRSEIFFSVISNSLCSCLSRSRYAAICLSRAWVGTALVRSSREEGFAFGSALPTTDMLPGPPAVEISSLVQTFLGFFPVFWVASCEVGASACGAGFSVLESDWAPELEDCEASANAGVKHKQKRNVTEVWDGVIKTSSSLV